MGKWQGAEIGEDVERNAEGSDGNNEYNSYVYIFHSFDHKPHYFQIILIWFSLSFLTLVEEYGGKEISHDS